MVREIGVGHCLHLIWVECLRWLIHRPTDPQALNDESEKDMNIQLGYMLLRDPRVSVQSKIIAMAIGAAVVAFIELLQIPLESVFAFILPIIGIAGDIVFDGAEAIIGTVFVATLLMPYLTPAHIVQQIRAEQAAGS
jgi:hypothetical protein